MKEITVISGKGGTGKTSIAAALLVYATSDAIAADCDVDAANMHLLLDPTVETDEPFSGGKTAVIEPELCTACGKCQEVCRFDAVLLKKEDGGRIRYRIDPTRCEGCRYCTAVCPVHAVTMFDALSGTCFTSRIRTGSWMVHAELLPGAENSGKLVARVKEQARAKARELGVKYLIVDGSPGIGCPVIASLSGTDFVLLVTEPTVSALHDLERVYKLTQQFQLQAGCIVNKSDLDLQTAGKIDEFLEGFHIPKLGMLPYDRRFSSALAAGRTPAEIDDPTIKESLRTIWNNIVAFLELPVR